MKSLPSPRATGAVRSRPVRRRPTALAATTVSLRRPPRFVPRSTIWKAASSILASRPASSASPVPANFARRRRGARGEALRPGRHEPRGGSTGGRDDGGSARDRPVLHASVLSWTGLAGFLVGIVDKGAGTSVAASTRAASREETSAGRTSDEPRSAARTGASMAFSVSATGARGAR